MHRCVGLLAAAILAAAASPVEAADYGYGYGGGYGYGAGYRSPQYRGPGYYGPDYRRYGVHGYYAPGAPMFYAPRPTYGGYQMAPVGYVPHGLVSRSVTRSTTVTEHYAPGY